MRLIHALLPLPVIAAGGVAINATACDAPQTENGGDPLFDGRVDPITSDAGDAACVPDDASNVTWASLYADMFGPAGIGQCGDSTRTGQNGTSSCHQNPGDNGAVASGFVCGLTQESCYEGITSANANFIGQQVVVPCSPDTSYLMQVLRHDGGGIMPYFPETVVFSDDDMNRVRAWIASGAPNNN